jgi:uncharacterized membrane protein YdjX (TVP38/TMEM64 family)
MLNKLIKRETLVVLGILLVLFFFILHYFFQSRFDWVEIKEHIKSFGIWAPAILLVIIIITSSIGFVFAIPVAIAALLLGVYWAFFISILGLSIGATLSFFIARYLGRDYLEKKYIHKMRRLNKYDKYLKKEGFIITFYLRLISLVPYELINILAGLSRIEFKKFFFATLLGIMPGTFITIYFVNSTKDIFSLNFGIAALIDLLFVLLPLTSKKIRRIIFHFTR